MTVFLQALVWVAMLSGLLYLLAAWMWCHPNREEERPSRASVRPKRPSKR